MHEPSRKPHFSGSPLAKALAARFRSRDATVGVIGLGYVGLPLVCRFSEAGFRTIGFDIDADKVASLKGGETYLSTVTGEKLRSALKRGFQPTTDSARAADAAPGEHDLPGNDGRNHPSKARNEGAAARRKLLPRLLARARGPGQRALLDAHHSKGVRRI